MSPTPPMAPPPGAAASFCISRRNGVLHVVIGSGLSLPEGGIVLERPGVLLEQQVRKLPADLRMVPTRPGGK